MEKIGTFFKSLLTIISPKLNTWVVYFFKFKKPIRLKNPQTLDEKIQWLKFHDYYKNSLVTQCADKYAVRDYVKSCSCPEILNDLYAVYDTVEEVDWLKLPDKFVIKWNFGCGQNLICFDKRTLNVEWARKTLVSWYKLRNRFYLPYSEMQYKGIKPKLVCEKLIETRDGGLPVDYKVYCFNGRAEYALLCMNRGTDGQHAKYYFVDRNWELQRFNVAGKNAPIDFSLPRPEGAENLFFYAEKLCKPFPFVRVDLYLEFGQVIFGELTFTPCGGFDVNRLPETQLLFGQKLRLQMK